MLTKQKISVKFEPGEFITQIDFPFAIKTSEGYISNEGGKKSIKWKKTKNKVFDFLNSYLKNSLKIIKTTFKKYKIFSFWFTNSIKNNYFCF